MCFFFFFLFVHFFFVFFFFFSSRRRHTRSDCDWSSDVCSSDLRGSAADLQHRVQPARGPASASLRASASLASCPWLVGEQVKIRLVNETDSDRSEERRVGKECRSRWSA